jgi:hypothetical protein
MSDDSADDFEIEEAADIELDGGDAIIRIGGDVPDVSVDGKVILNNLMISVGGDTPEKGTDEHRVLYARKIINAIACAAYLTGTAEHVIAGCRNTEYIRNYKITEHDLAKPLPPYVMAGNSLENHMVNRVEACYETYCQALRAAQIQAMGGDATAPLRHPKFEKIRSLLSSGIRFFLQHWHLHPALSREQNYAEGTVCLFTKINSKTKPPQIIAKMVAEKIDGYVSAELRRMLRAEVCLQGNKDSTFNELATKQLQRLIPHYLATQKYKWSAQKHALDKLTAMQEYIGTLPDGHEEKIKFDGFIGLVPFESDTYKKAKAAAKITEANRVKRAIAAEKREENKKQRLVIQNAIIATIKDPSVLPPVDPVTVEARHDLKENELKEKLTEFMDELPTFKILEQTMRPAKAPISGTVDDISCYSPPTKYYDAVFPDKKSVNVSYGCAGEIFTRAVKTRFHNIVTVLNLFDEAHPNVMRDLFDSADELIKDNGSVIPMEGLASIVAIFMDSSGAVVSLPAAAGSKWPTVESLKYAGCLDHEENFSKDMITLLPTFFHKGNNAIFMLTAFGLLATRNEGFGGMGHQERWDEIDSLMDDINKMSASVASQVRLLAVVTMGVVDKAIDGYDGGEQFHPFSECFDCELVAPTSKKAKRAI